MEPTDKNKVGLSPLEEVAYHLGMLSICVFLENLCRRDLSADPELEAFLADTHVQSFIGCILARVATFSTLPAWLNRFAPDDDVLKPLVDSLKSDANGFVAIEKRVIELRVERDVFVTPKPEVPRKDTPPAPLSILENYSYIIGQLRILDFCEQAFRCGGISVAVLWKIGEQFLLPTSKHLDYFDDLIAGDIIDRTDQERLDRVADKFRKWSSETDHYYKDVHEKLVLHHRTLFPKLGRFFVDQFLLNNTEYLEEFMDRYLNDEPMNQVRKILLTLQDRAIARRQAIENAEYNRLPVIDDNVKHLLDTLKQYGIKASTYDDARRQYERISAATPSKASRDITKEVRDRCLKAVKTKRAFLEDCERLCALHPESAEQIRWEYQQAIDKLDL